ncbi:MAG: exonuclease subunit SbcD [Bacteroidales bacterium]|nr:exonuclease subunit SbcD [Bacteroidales bacterium]
MKILHTSDWHIGQQFYNHDRAEEHLAFFVWLAEMVKAHQPDALLVSGDVFHTGMPSAASRKLYTDSLLKLHEACREMQIIVTAGNHDSSSFLEADGNLWDLARVKVVGHFMRPEDHVIRVMRGEEIVGYVVALPHSYPQNIPVLVDGAERADRLGAFAKEAVSGIAQDGLPVVLMAHTTVSGFDFSEKLESVGTIDTVTLDSFGEGFDYMALGHIHMPQSVVDGSRMARYCGTPIPIGFSEDFGHSVSLVSLSQRGELPVVEELAFEGTVPVKTVPFHPVGLDETLDYIAKHPFSEKTYVRVQISSKTYLPMDSADRVAKAVAEAGGLYCLIKLVRTDEQSDASTVSSMDVSELREADPLDIACRYYQEKHHLELGDELKEMLKQVCEDLKA